MATIAVTKSRSRIENRMSAILPAKENETPARASVARAGGDCQRHVRRRQDRFAPDYQLTPVETDTPYRMASPIPALANELVVSSPIVPPKPAPPVGGASTSQN